MKGPQVRVAHAAGDFFTVAGDEGHAGAGVEQGNNGVNVRWGEVQFCGDAFRFFPCPGCVRGAVAGLGAVRVAAVPRCWCRCCPLPVRRVVRCGPGCGITVTVAAVCGFRMGALCAHSFSFAPSRGSLPLEAACSACFCGVPGVSGVAAAEHTNSGASASLNGYAGPAIMSA